MSNMITYVEQEFRSFEEFPFNTVDSLIFSWLSYIRLPMEPNSDRKYSFASLFRAEKFPQMFEKILNKESTKELFTAVVASPRYRNVYLKSYQWHTDKEQEKQFAAVTFVVEEGLYYVAFRGTDSTFIGWKEDLNMAFQYPIPSQEDAADYLKKIAESTTARLLVGGHSKGGNIAIYAAANNPELYDRIEKVYSHDGPGFPKEVLQSSLFQKISDKVEKTVPQSSLIGLLFEQSEKYQIIKSTGKNVGQHDPFTWDIENSSLCVLTKLTKDAVYTGKIINEWLDTVPIDEKERFVNVLYSLSESVSVDNFLDFGQDIPGNLSKMVGYFGDLDLETRNFMLRLIGSLATYSVKSMSNEVISHVTGEEKQ